MRIQFRFAILLPLITGITAGAEKPTARIDNLTPAQMKAIVEQWPECDEYMSQSRCKVTINLSNVPQPPGDDDPPVADAAGSIHGPLMPHAHWDVEVKPFKYSKGKLVPRGEAAILLVRSSPFIKCTVAGTPAAPARDLSANIGTLLTAVAGIGAPAAATADAELDRINGEIGNIEKQADQSKDDIPAAYLSFAQAVKDNWKFTFPSDDAAATAIGNLKAGVDNVGEKLRAFAGLAESVSIADGDLARYDKAHPAGSGALTDAQKREIHAKARIENIKALVSDLADQQKLILQVKDYLKKLTDTDHSLYTTQALTMAYFSGKSVTETVSCKDAITKDPAFDNVIFTAFYEAVPHLDISVGAIGSLLGGRQTGALSGPFTTQQAAVCGAAAASGSTTPCGPGTILGYTTKSSYQFMPGVFVEWRLVNFRLPWATNGTPAHRAGYLGSIGIAGGVAINPNNGGPAAEFFEGLSFGIQRFAILAGVHNGRYEEFGGGYYAGEPFPPGTTVTPPTVYGWATHPAFGIAYRIPIR